MVEKRSRVWRNRGVTPAGEIKIRRKEEGREGRKKRIGKERK